MNLYKYLYSTSLTKQEIISRLRDNTCQDTAINIFNYKIVTIKETNKNFIGTIKKNEFKLVRNNSSHYAFLPIINGIILKSDVNSNTTIKIHVFYHPIVSLFVILLLIIVLVILIIFNLVGIMSLLLNLTFFSFIIVVVLASLILIKSDFKKMINELLEILE